jgi:hypothetical protein
MLPPFGQGNLLTLLFRGGNEFLNAISQQQYNQGNEISWLD